VIGILGGTFDPPHNGHVALAEGAFADLGIDELVVMVVAQPGHRPCIEGAEVRMRLAEAAFRPLPRTRLVREEHPYTVDALAAADFGDAVFIVGADEGAAFPHWKEPERILELVRLAVGTRSGYPPPDLRQYGDRVVAFELPSPLISSSDIRARIEAGETLDGLVPPAVAALIEDEGLYRRGSGLH
jgi:nicotinate-nucleotide adenylyltransferase